MEKKITDYLHLYMGCKVNTPDGARKLLGLNGLGNATVETQPKEIAPSKGYFLYHESQVTPILRPLSDMTEEEWIYVLSLAKGIVIEDDSIYKVARTADNEVCIKTGKVQFLIRYQHCNDADDRVPKGVSFKLKYFYTSESLEVSERGINEVENEFNQVEGDWENFCFNQTEIFLFLLSKGFDLFGLIDAKLAINSTTLK